MVQERLLDFRGGKMAQNLSPEQLEGISATAQSKLEQFKSFGWILRFTESRDARIRNLTWEFLT